jgi:hypothetical protein
VPDRHGGKEQNRPVIRLVRARNDVAEVRLPEKPTDSPSLGPAHQQRIDAMQAAIRAGGASARPSIFREAPPRPGPSKSELDHRLAEELEYIVRQLEQVGGVLADDPILLTRHARSLQSIDAMKQSLRNLASVIAADNKASAVDFISLTELKARLQRKGIRSLGD